MCEVAAKCRRIVSETALQLTFVKSGYRVGGYIRAITDVHLKMNIRNSVAYEIGVQGVSAKDRFGFTRDEESSFVQAFGGGQECSGL